MLRITGIHASRSFELSPVLLVGVDLVRIADVAESLRRHRDHYTSRMFTANEIAYCQRDAGMAPQRFAARFAAKEATIKVLRPCVTDTFLWTSIEVERAPEGWCSIMLHGATADIAREAGILKFALSMSHEDDYATATVVAWG